LWALRTLGVTVDEGKLSIHEEFPDAAVATIRSFLVP
jgi:hypothetical protein